MTSFERAYRHLSTIQDKLERENLAVHIPTLRGMIAAALHELGQGMADQPVAHRDQHFGAVTHAQHGDDLMILNLFALMGIERPSYLDLGAHDPFIISNTALLYKRGSRGVNVEANPVLIERFKEFRPEDTNVNVGVGTQAGEATFYKYSDTSGRNTFSSQEVDSLKGVMSVREKVTLPVKTLPQILDEYCGGKYPHLLSCDIEGLDYDVLLTLPMFHGEHVGPNLICVETRKHETDRMRAMLFDRGYILHCRMGENLFFVRSDCTRFMF